MKHVIFLIIVILLNVEVYSQITGPIKMCKNETVTFTAPNVEYVKSFNWYITRLDYGYVSTSLYSTSDETLTSCIFTNKGLEGDYLITRSVTYCTRKVLGQCVSDDTEHLVYQIKTFSSISNSIINIDASSVCATNNTSINYTLDSDANRLAVLLSPSSAGSLSFPQSGQITIDWLNNYYGDVALSTRAYYETGGYTCYGDYVNNGTISVSTINGGTIGTNQTICNNSIPSTLVNSVSASGGPSITYKWQYSINNSTWYDVSGATSLTYSPPALTSTRYYRRVATNSCGSAYSNTVTITVYNSISGGTIGTAQSICNGTAPSTLTNTAVASGGNNSFTYQWQSSTNNSTWTNISGATSLAYAPPILTQNTYYRRVATTGCGTAYSNTILITVYSALSGGTIATNQNVCFNGTPTALTNSTVASGGNGTITYQWQSSLNNTTWTNISGATSSIYAPPALTQLTYYRRAATNSCGTAYSNTVTITVYSEISGGTIAANQTICYNSAPSALTNSSSPTGGNGSFTYQWQISSDGTDWTNITGASSITYSPSAITQTTYYRRVATNSCGTAYSNTIIISVYNNISGGSISSNQTICFNGIPSTITSSSTATGGNGTITYQWQSSLNNSTWSNILNATSLTYSPGTLTQTTYYRRAATNTCGTSYSNTITIVVYADLSNNVIAGNQSINYNTIPSPLTNTSLPSGGNGTFTYQWQISGNGGSTWENITGATSSTYSPGALTQTTNYRRAATNSCGTNYSNNVTVTVFGSLNGGVIASDQTICYNSTPSQITNTTLPSGGSGTFSYQWEISTNGSSWTQITGATSLTYSPSALTQTTYYRRAATNTSGTAYSNNIAITIYNNISGGIITAEQTICYNGVPSTLTSSTTASGGNGVFSYQWQSSLNNSTWSNILNANSQNYSPGILTQTTYYRRSATNSCGTVNSNTILITVYNNLHAGTIASNQMICYNTLPALLTNTSVASGGDGAYTYQWQYSTDNINWNIVEGSNSLEFSPPALTQTTYYRRAVINSCGTAYSNTITISVYGALSGGIILNNQTICYNSAPEVLINSVLPSGGNGTFSYQWQISYDGAIWGDISGATNLTYSPGTLTKTTYYQRAASNSCGTAYSNPVQITVHSNLIGGNILSDQTVCYNNNPSSLISTLAASGGNGTFSYQWQSSINNTSWSNISEANTLDYSPGVLTQTTNYRRAATNTCGTVNSNTITISVYGALSGGTIASNQTICYNTLPAELTNTSVASGGDGAYTYQWQYSTDNVNWNIVEGSNSLGFSPPALTQTTYYRRAATNSCGTAYSNTVTITIYSALNGGAILNNQTICNNSIPSTIINSVLPSGGNGTFTYQWQISNDGVLWGDIINATGTTYSPPALTQTTYYRRAANSSCEAVYSNVIVITVLQAIEFNLADISACYGDIVTISAPVGFLNYIWSNGVVGTNSINVQAALTTTYSCTVVNGSGCSVNDQMVLTVNAPQTISLSNIDACVNDSVILEAPLGFRTYFWSNGDSSRTTSVIADITKNYIIYVTDNNNCNNSTSINVAANPYPVINMEDKGINEGETITLQAPTGYAEYLWNTGHLTDNIQVNPTIETKYWVRITTAKGCQASDSLTVFIYNLPDISFQNISMCTGETITIEAPKDFVSYEWSSGEKTRSIVVSPVITTVYNVTVTNEHGGSGSAQVIVYVSQTPQASLKSDTICFGDTLNLETLYKNSYSYLWNVPNQNSPILKVIGTETKEYEVIVSDTNGCSNKVKATITVEKPDATFSVSKSNVLPGDMITFLISNPKDYDIEYSWDFGDGFKSDLKVPTHIYYIEGNYDVSLKVKTQNLCESETTQEALIVVGDGKTGIDINLTNLGITSYPNPFEDYINIDASAYDKDNDIVVTLLDITGRRIVTKKVSKDKEEIQTNNLKAGIYILEINVNGFVSTRKLIKE